MGDSDCSYDFGEVPRFLDKLEEGYDLVMGNRFAGGIMPGAMPWHHRYIGNPLLSGLGRLLYRTPCRDWHCGLRAFDREKLMMLRLASDGMEFASEMVIGFSRSKSMLTELPVVLVPDARERPPHLRSFSDGVRHLRVLSAGFFSERTLRLLACTLEWPVIGFITSLSLIGLVLGMGIGTATTVSRLSPNSVVLRQDSENPQRLLGEVRLKNQLGGEVQKLEVHVGCRCTILEKSPMTLANGKEVSIAVTVENSKSTTQLVLINFELSRNGNTIPVSEIVTLVLDE